MGPFGPYPFPAKTKFLSLKETSMADHSKMKLGRKAVKTDTRTLMLGNYLASTLPPPPAAYDQTKGVTGWGMMMNDTLGDCTIAGLGHAVQVWTVNGAGI